MDKKHLFSRLLKKAIVMAVWTKAGLCGKSSLLEQSLPRTPSRPKTSVPSVAEILRVFVPSWLKNPFNQCNPRLMKYLYAFGTFTTVEKALQIRPFMQNEPNFPESQMNVNNVLTKDYEDKSNWTLGENEPNTNPNEPNQSQFVECSK